MMEQGGSWFSDLPAWAHLVLDLLVLLVGGTAVTVRNTDKLNGVGARVEENKAGLLSLEGAVNVIKESQLQSKYDREGLHEKYGRLTSDVESLADTVAKYHEDKLGFDREIIERLVKIESQTNFAKQLGDGVSEIADVMRESLQRRDRE